MKASERFSNLMKGKPIDRLPVLEWAPWWDLTIKNWQTQGLPNNLDGFAIQKYFGLDRCGQSFVPVRTAQTPTPAVYGHGIIKNEEDYEKVLPTLYPEVQFPKEYVDWLKKLKNEDDSLLFFTVEGFFWYPRELFGIEDHLYSFYDNEDLYFRMIYDYSQWLKKTLEYIGNTFRYDFMTFAEDMSYNNGPMISKELFDKFLAPSYKKIIPLLKQMDIPVFIDSDGDITLAVDWYASVGADGMLPLERQAGVDISIYIKKHPEMAFLGHFDKMCMKFGEEAMRNEFERLLPSMIKGKFIPGCDHQTPPDVSIENYKIYVRLLKEYATKAVQMR